MGMVDAELITILSLQPNMLLEYLSSYRTLIVSLRAQNQIPGEREMEEQCRQMVWWTENQQFSKL